MPSTSKPSATASKPKSTAKPQQDQPLTTPLIDAKSAKASKSTPVEQKTQPSAKTAPKKVETPADSSDSDSSDSSSSDSSDSSDSDSDDDIELPTNANSMNDNDSSTPASTKPQSAPIRTLKRAEVWFDLQVPPFDLGRVVIELFPDCPLAYENFRALCTGEVTDPCTKEKLTYAGSLVDQINDDYIVLGEICDNADERTGIEIIQDDKEGDDNDIRSLEDMAKEILPQSKWSNVDDTKLTVEQLKDKYASLKAKSAIKAQVKINETKMNIVHDTKKPAVSIYGGFFPDEKAGLQREHLKPGTVSMFAEKTNRNGSKFLITLKPHMKWLDGQYTVIGHVTSGLRALYSLREYADSGETAVISDCGRLKKGMENAEKQNSFLAQAKDMLAAQQSEATVKDAKKKEPIKCTTCGGKTKYVCRQLGKGVKYHCQDKKCKTTIWVQDTKFDPIVIQKAIELQKQSKAALHEQQHMQGKKFRQEERQKEKEARAARKAALAAAAAAAESAQSKNGKKGAKDEPIVIPVVEKKKRETKPAVDDKNVKYASPFLATAAQQFLEHVVVHKQLKEANAEAAKEDHKQFELRKRLERGEIDEEGNELISKRKFNHHHDDGDDGDDDGYGDGDDIRHRHKRSKFDNSRKSHQDEEVALDTDEPIDANTKALREIARNPKSKEYKELIDSLEKMDKESRRQIRKQLGLPAGPSKTAPTNMNKRDRNVDPRLVRSVANGKTRLADAKTMMKNGTGSDSGSTRKKKDKTRWRNRDQASLPEGYIVREVRTKKAD